MAAAVDVVYRRAVEPHRDAVLSDPLTVWLEGAFGDAVKTRARFERALTHGSQAADNYERLEFLGDRVLGLAMAEWLYERFPDEPEGQMSKRLNALVTGPVCADIARELGVGPHLKLGKQARDDGAAESDNVLGDVTEALIGALYLDAGFDAARDFIRERWADRIDHQLKAPQHPKSALQEWAAANNRRPPTYEIVERSGPHHSPRFTIKVSVGKLAEAEGHGTSKQEAETAAAAALLDTLKS